MLITDIWFDKMKSTLMSIYPNGLNEKALDAYLKDKIDKGRAKIQPVLCLRNIYKKEIFEMNADEIMDFVHDNELIIGANGSFVEAAKNKKSEIAEIVESKIAARTVEKNAEKRYEVAGELKLAKKHNNLQNKEKQDTNSYYGVMTQSGSILFNIDSAGLITSQARQLISEAMNGFEKFLSSNPQCVSFNEAILLFDSIKHCEKNDKYRGYISYFPTKRDVRKRLLRYLVDTNGYLVNANELKRSLFYYTENLTDDECLYLYYKHNLFDLLFKNPKIFNIINAGIMQQAESFDNPYAIPELFINSMNLLGDIVEEYVMHIKTTPRRVYKYQNCKRDSVIGSDTDSNIIWIGIYVEKILKAANLQGNDDNFFKAVNVISVLMSRMSKKLHLKFIRDCNIQIPPEKSRLNMKNEFYFRNFLIYKKVKKNYVGYCLLREGNRLPEAKRIFETGIKLTMNHIHPYVSALQKDIVANDILRAEKIDIAKILFKIQKAKNEIVKMIKSGDRTFGVRNRFAGMENYKVLTAANCRTAEIWNRLYPMDTILPGDTIYTFKTSLYNEKECDKIEDEEIKQKIKETIFAETYEGTPNYLRSNGLKLFSMPEDGMTMEIPKWIIPFIDAENMAKNHLKSIIDLLPSFSGKLTRISSTDYSYSNMKAF